MLENYLIIIFVNVESTNICFNPNKESIRSNSQFYLTCLKKLCWEKSLLNYNNVLIAYYNFLKLVSKSTVYC